MSEYQLGLIAPQRIDALRLEGETYRRMLVRRQPRHAAHIESARLIAMVRLLVRRLVPAS